VNSCRKLLAAFLLFAWLGAGWHVALEHAGAGLVTHRSDAGHCVDPQECGGLPGETDHHHHPPTVATAARFAQGTEHKAPVQFWVPLDDTLRVAFAALPRSKEAGTPPRSFFDPPPDPRSTGWLFAVRTAFPVRAPSHSA
jgi:hypothetical protein